LPEVPHAQNNEKKNLKSFEMSGTEKSLKIQIGDQCYDFGRYFAKNVGDCDSKYINFLYKK
jgi:hypothetical protein